MLTCASQRRSRSRRLRWARSEVAAWSRFWRSMLHLREHVTVCGMAASLSAWIGSPHSAQVNPQSQTPSSGSQYSPPSGSCRPSRCSPLGQRSNFSPQLGQFSISLLPSSCRIRIRETSARSGWGSGSRRVQGAASHRRGGPGPTLRPRPEQSPTCRSRCIRRARQSARSGATRTLCDL